LHTPQVRLQGCKGVLSRNSLLRHKQLQVRPSMEKFDSNHPQLELCSVAMWLPSYLNRQVITFMVYNGVPEQVRNRPLNSFWLGHRAEQRLLVLELEPPRRRREEGAPFSCRAACEYWGGNHHVRTVCESTRFHQN
jgi:hypothetical protein